MMNTTPKPGIYPGVPFDEYLKWPAVSNSKLSCAAKSPAHFRAGELAATNNTSTESQQLGTLLHCGKLEPSLLAESHIVMPRFEEQIFRSNGQKYSTPKATSQYKSLVATFREANPGKVIVPQDGYIILESMLKALSSNERAIEYLDHDGPAELSIVWDDPVTGIRCKARVDKLDQIKRRAVDLKSTRDAADFTRSILKYAYHRQLAFYVDGLQAIKGESHEACLVAVESREPFGVRAAPLAHDTLNAGRLEYQRLLRLIETCRKTNEYPDYSNPDNWTLPEWPEESVRLTVGGESVTI